MSSASASGVAMAVRRGSNGRLLIAKSENMHAGREHPKGHESEQEPVNVGIEIADVQRARAETEEADDAGKPADDQAREENLLDEIQHHRKALLDFRDIVIVSPIKG